MSPFELATWASVVILVVGALMIFLWFLRDARSVLRGTGTPDASGQDQAGGPPESRE